MDITPICHSVNNYFPKEIKTGEFELTTETAPVSMLDGQYFRVKGSILNDGVYQNNAESLATIVPETFKGTITLMAVPKDFIGLCNEIDSFNAKIFELGMADTGFTSESFGGYSYSKAANLSGALQQQYNGIVKRLSAYRRIGNDV